MSPIVRKVGSPDFATIGPTCRYRLAGLDMVGLPPRIAILGGALFLIAFSALGSWRDL